MILITAGAILPVIALFIPIANVLNSALAETNVTTIASALRLVVAWKHLARVQTAAHVLKMAASLGLALVKIFVAVGSLAMNVVRSSEQMKLTWCLKLKDQTYF